MLNHALDQQLPPTNYRRRLRHLLSIALALLTAGQSLLSPAQADDRTPREVDVLIYGATPAGIAAAISAGQQGSAVLLVEPTQRIGGLVTSGLSHTDFRTLEGLNGTFLEFTRRVEAYYIEKYGPNSPQVETSFHGTFGEPKINLLIFQQMLAEHPSITVVTGWRLSGVTTEPLGTGLRRITSATFQQGDKPLPAVTARVFVDGSYEGDLMAEAGVPWRAGREGQAEFKESLAPAQADGELQAYNFRFVMTPDPENRTPPLTPPGYRREDFLAVLPLLESGTVKKVFDYPSNCIFKAQTPALPNNKYDINDVSRGAIRLSLPGQNLDWPNGDAETRQRIYNEHLRDQAGLLYFLQTDAAVPERFRQEALEWGFCKDEFTDTGHFPPQLYVREARRMVGQHIFTQHDSEHAPQDARSVLHRDAIALGDYGNNCHGTSHEGPRFGGRHTGEFYHAVPPYQIPYGVIVPREISNLLVPGAVSATHVGFCALRLEPIWTSLGQAAGHAAALAIESQSPIQSVPIAALQQRLHADGSATIYVSDVRPGSPDFAAVQWWGTLGGLHGLVPPPAKPGQRGKNLHGQYYAATPGHAVELDRALEPELAARWRQLATEAGVNASRLPSTSETTAVTRGDFIRAAYRAARSQKNP